MDGRFRNRNIDVPKAFVFWKGGLGTEILMFLRHLCFWKGGLGTEILVFLRQFVFWKGGLGTDKQFLRHLCFGRVV